MSLWCRDRIVHIGTIVSCRQYGSSSSSRQNSPSYKKSLLKTNTRKERAQETETRTQTDREDYQQQEQNQESERLAAGASREFIFPNTLSYFLHLGVARPDFLKIIYSMWWVGLPKTQMYYALKSNNNSNHNSPPGTPRHARSLAALIVDHHHTEAYSAQ
jgi:hypothetical protein